MLSIVIPVFNEAACIERVVREWLAVLAKVPGRLILIDDGSTDGTSDILRALAPKYSNLEVVHQKNAGHGEAVLRGYQIAVQGKYSFVFQTDSDDQFDSQDFWALWEKRNEFPFILGVRKNRRDPLTRLIISRSAVLINFLLFGAFIRDGNIPYRLMRVDLLRELLGFLPDHPFAPNLFCSVIARRAGLTVPEVPVTHRARGTGMASLLRWKLLSVCFRSVLELVRFRFDLKEKEEGLSRMATRNFCLPETETTSLQKNQR